MTKNRTLKLLSNYLFQLFLKKDYIYNIFIPRLGPKTLRSTTFILLCNSMLSKIIISVSFMSSSMLHSVKTHLGLLNC